MSVEKVRLPAGSFDAVRIVYRVEKRDGSELYQVLTNSRGAKMLLEGGVPKRALRPSWWTSKRRSDEFRAFKKWIPR